MTQETELKNNIEEVTRKDVWNFTKFYWGKQKFLFLLSFVLITITVIVDAFLPVVIGWIVNAVTSSQDKSFDWSSAVAQALVALIVLEIVYHSLRYFAFYAWNIFAVRNLHTILNDAFSKVQRFSTDWHANIFAGGTVRKIARGMWAFDQYEDIIHHYLYSTFIMLVVTVTIMFVKWPIMGVVTLLCSVIYVIISSVMVLKINTPLFKISAKSDTKVGAVLADSVTANSTVKIFGNEDIEDRMLLDVSNSWKSKSLRAWQASHSVDLVRRFMSLAMMAAMIYASLYLWSKGEADAGDVVYVITAFIVLSNYLRNIGEQLANLQKSISEMEDVIGFWKKTSDVRDKEGAGELVANEGKICFDNVSFSYESGAGNIYNDFSIDINEGEHVALVGHSGSGKFTFVKLIQRLYDIDSGYISIDGQNIADVTQSSLRRAIALVPQEPILFHRSLSENIAYGRPNATKGEIVKAAKQAYAHDFISRLPQGYDTLVGERGVKLSGGERQRVAIARAILSDCPVLILDEATSALDSVSEHEIQQALKALMRGRTTITIAHRLATIKSVDRIIVFDDGKVIEQGTHSELVATDGSKYKQLFDMQALDLIGTEKVSEII